MALDKNTMVVLSEPTCAADEAKVLCIIRDLTAVDTAQKISLNLPASTTAIQLVEEVAKQRNYEPDSFVLSYECQAGGGVDDVSINTFGSKPLREILGNVGNGKRNNFIINDKDGEMPKKCKTADASTTDGSSEVACGLNKEFHYTCTGPPSSNYYSSLTSDYSYASAVMKSDTGYIGLVNQAMTCYLNSLLQTLFMTPEFRNALYRWAFDGQGEEAAKSIPYQLQLLFLQLQTGKCRAAETTGLTRSFGWDSSEAWQQHDVQELCRVMFDALETKWKNTDQADLINKLYQGKMKDYVKCLECGYESSKTDVYLDIPLVLRPFGADKAYESVAEALNAFIQPEILNESNQYFCEKCNKKCDAHKGLKFESFPYLLTLQLKRFDFDYTTMHRIKLNDKMTFPPVLDLNNLIHGLECKGEEEEEEELDSVGVDLPDGSGDHSEEAIDEGIDLEVSASGTTSTASSETSSISSEPPANERNTQGLKSGGPFVYELFSIMIHSGSAAGGHYYAYIKSFKDNQWYSFNDQHVTRITHEDIKKTYGGCGSGSRGYYSSMYMSSTNAYMLMYRLKDKEQNADFMKPEDFPPHIKEELQKLKEKEEAEKRQKEIDRSTCKIKLFCEHPVQLKKVDIRFEVNKDKTVTEATEQAYKLLDLDGVVTLDCCRLVKYDEFNDTLEKSFDGEEDSLISDVLGGIKSTYSFDLLLEIKQPGQHWQTYKQGGVTCRVHVVDLENDSISPPVNVRAYTTQTVAEFQSLIGEVLDIPTENMRTVLERASEFRYLNTLDQTLKAEGFIKSNKVFIECSGKEDESIPFMDSQFHQILDRYENTITLHATLPSIEEVKLFLEQKKVTDAIRERICEGHMSDLESDRLTNSSAEGSDGSYANYEPPGLCRNEDFVPEKNWDEEIAEEEANRSNKETVPLNGQSNILFDELSEKACPNLPNDGNGSALPENKDDQGTMGTLEGLTITESFDSQNMTDASDSSSQTDQTLKNTPSEDSLHSEGSGSNASCHVYQIDSTSSQPDSDNLAADIGQKKDGGSWDTSCQDQEIMYDYDEQYRKYFKAYLMQNTSDCEPRRLTVYVDKRITLGGLKKELEQYVGTTSDNFKVFRVYPNNQEFESTRLADSLVSFGEESRLTLKLGRALRKGEYRVKVYQLLIHNPEPIKFLIDTVFAKGMTVLESKLLILPEIKKECNLDIPLNRCRLRKKTWKNPGTIYMNPQVYEDDIPIFANWDIFVEVLKDEEKLTSPSQYAIYVRRWRPSKYQLEPFDEIVINSSSVDELKHKLHLLSGIAAEDIEFAKCRGTFPCETSLLEIHNDLEWNPQVSNLYVFPLYICDDGCVIYYRDGNEPLLELTDEKRREIQQKETIRLSKMNQKVTSSPRKERALKIYTDDPPPSS